MPLTPTKPQTPEAMSRGEFLKSLGLSGATLMAFYCMGTLTACTNSTEDPTPGTTNTNTNPTTGKIDFTIDLAKELTTDNSFVYKSDIIVVRLTSTSFVALSKVCTHQGTTVEYRPSKGDIYCSNHGSVFKTDGTVSNGPAMTALKKYNTEVKTGTLRVFE